MTQTYKAPAEAAEGGECCGGLGSVLPPRLFKALSDPTRIGLLIHIAEADGPCTVGDVAREVPIDVSVVSRHLAVLRDAGVIECVRHGKEVRCSLRTTDVVKALRDLADALERCCPGRESGDGETPTSRKAGEDE